MKALKVFTAIILIVSMLAMPVIAAEFVPSIEVKRGTSLADYGLDSEIPNQTVHIIPYSEIFSDDIIDEEGLGLDPAVSEAMEESIRERLKSVMAELIDNLIHHLVPDFEAEWERVTGGAPLENAIIHDLFEIVQICTETDTIKTGNKITVSIQSHGIDADELFAIVYKPFDSEEWQVAEYTIDENGIITFVIDSRSTVAIVKDSGKAPAADVTSPQTGVEESGTAAAAMIAVVLAAGTAVVVKKLRKTTVQ